MFKITEAWIEPRAKPPMVNETVPILFEETIVNSKEELEELRNKISREFNDSLVYFKYTTILKL